MNTSSGDIGIFSRCRIRELDNTDIFRSLIWHPVPFEIFWVPWRSVQPCFDDVFAVLCDLAGDAEVCDGQLGWVDAAVVEDCYWVAFDGFQRALLGTKVSFILEADNIVEERLCTYPNAVSCITRHSYHSSLSSRRFSFSSGLCNFANVTSTHCQCITQ